MLDLRQLRYFVAVGEELHFGRAAERLGMAQPPLSQQIRRLERRLGVALFWRSKRKVELSEAGRVLLDEARRILAAAEHAAIAAQRSGRGEAGSLRIGYTTGCAFIKVVLDLLRRYREDHPGVVLSLAEMHTSEQLDALVEGRIDLAFIRSRLADPERVFSTFEIMQEPLITALPMHHPAAKREAVALADLGQEPFIMFPRSVGTGLFDIIVGACRDAGFTPRVVQEAPQFTSIIGLVSAGLGVALIPSALAQIRLDGVVYRPLLGAEVSAPVMLVARRRDASAVVAAFAKMARGISKPARPPSTA